MRALLDERKAQGVEIAELRRRLALARGAGGGGGAGRRAAGCRSWPGRSRGVSGKDLRGLIDEHKTRLGRG